jgi:uncharacterized DUF497 family protein
MNNIIDINTRRNYNIIINSVQFEWDYRKEEINIMKHGISFSTAAMAFSDDVGILKYDKEHSDTEERYILIGQSRENQLLVVCHCYLKEKSVRIISARKATGYEAAEYRRRK